MTITSTAGSRAYPFEQIVIRAQRKSFDGSPPRPISTGAAGLTPPGTTPDRRVQFPRVTLRKDYLYNTALTGDPIADNADVHPIEEQLCRGGPARWRCRRSTNTSKKASFEP